MSLEALGRCAWAARVVADLLLLSAKLCSLLASLPWGFGQILSLLVLWRQRGELGLVQRK